MDNQVETFYIQCHTDKIITAIIFKMNNKFHSVFVFWNQTHPINWIVEQPIK